MYSFSVPFFMHNMPTSISSATLSLALCLIKANAIEQFWTWEPLQSLDLSTMDPAWDFKEAGNVKIFICRVKKGNEILVGSYQDPPPSFDPKNKCCMVDSSNQPVNEEDKSKIEIMKYSHEKVRWVKVNANNRRAGDDIEGIRPHLISVGNEGEEKFVCRFLGPMNDAYIGRVQPTGNSFGCGSGEHGVFGTAIAFQYEIQAAN